MEDGGFDDAFVSSNATSSRILPVGPPPPLSSRTSGDDHVNSLETKLERMRTTKANSDKKVGREMAREMSRWRQNREKQNRDGLRVDGDNFAEQNGEETIENWSESSSDDSSDSSDGETKMGAWERSCFGCCFSSKRRKRAVIVDRNNAEGDEGSNLIDREWRMQAKNKPKLRNWKSTDDRMALKSNAFAPKMVALGGRQLVDDHMTAHYNRLRNARPSVDTSTPKAMLSDVRVRDRDKKEGSSKRRPFSAVTLARDSGQDDKVVDADLDSAQNSTERSRPGVYVLKSYEGRRRADSARTLPAWKPAGIYGLNDPSGAIPVQSRSQNKTTTDDVEKKLLDEKGGTEEVQDERVDGNGDKDDVESFMASHRSLTSLGRVSEFHEQRLDETLKKQQNEDKELLYLEFISDLTNDILTRGIYSNRALQLVFESHMQRRKNELDERIMREKVKQLEEDLGIV